MLRRANFNASLVCFGFLLPLWFQSAASSDKPVRITEQIPRFENYPSGRIYAGAPSKIIWPKDTDPRDPEVGKLRDVLDPIPRKVNFASHYAIVEYGCGTNCGEIAIVDMKTGDLLDVRPYYTMEVDVEKKAGVVYKGLSFRRGSRLLIASGCFDWDAPNSTHECGTKYYLFKDNKFELLKFSPGPVPKPFRNSR